MVPFSPSQNLCWDYVITGTISEGLKRFAAQSIQDVSFHALRACLSRAFPAHWDMSFVQKHRRINCELNRLDFVNIGSCPKWYKVSEPAIAQNGTPQQRCAKGVQEALIEFPHYFFFQTQTLQRPPKCDIYLLLNLRRLRVMYNKSI